MLVVNLLSRAALELSTEAYLVFQGWAAAPGSLEPPGDEEQDFHAFLRESLFLLPDDFDELAYIKERSRAERFDQSQLGLVIAPTQSCNFSCHYCFETHPPGELSPDFQRRVVNLVEERLPGRRELAVQWFGGEPLQSLGVIDRLSGELLRLANKHGAGYAATVITNGYLMSRPVAERLRADGVVAAQVSLDGDRALHDRTRFERPGQGSFDRIVENVCAAGDLFDITLRVHVAPFNVPSVHALVDTLAERGVARSVSEIYFAPLFNYRPNMKETPYRVDGRRFMGAREFAAVQADLLRHARERGFRTPDPLKASWGICTAVRENTIVVDAQGDLFKCYKDVGNARESYGRAGEAVALDVNRTKWLDIEVPRDAECRECQFLPVCFGGCTKQWQEGASKDVICTPLKFNWRERLPLELAPVAEAIGR